MTSLRPAKTTVSSVSRGLEVLAKPKSLSSAQNSPSAPEIYEFPLPDSTSENSIRPFLIEVQRLRNVVLDLEVSNRVGAVKK